MNWLLGQYVLSAMSTALDNGFNGRKAKTKYIKDPIMSSEYYGLSEDEINDLKLKKMVEFEMSIIERQNRNKDNN